MTNKFKVGDKVWCIKHGQYNFTDYHVPCLVTSIFNHNTVGVKIFENGTGDFIVNSKYYELIKKTIDWKKRLSK